MIVELWQHHPRCGDEGELLMPVTSHLTRPNRPGVTVMWLWAALGCHRSDHRGQTPDSHDHNMIKQSDSWYHQHWSGDLDSLFGHALLCRACPPHLIYNKSHIHLRFRSSPLRNSVILVRLLSQSALDDGENMKMGPWWPWLQSEWWQPGPPLCQSASAHQDLRLVVGRARSTRQQIGASKVRCCCQVSPYHHTLTEDLYRLLKTWSWLSV